MPIKVQNDLPAKKVLEKENIFVMDEKRAVTQDIRPLKIAILNLMPLKEDTEVQLMRSLSNTPLQLDLTFLTTASYVGHNTATSHLDTFYMTYEDVKNVKFDGMIITGAPVELMPFEEVAYWEELKKIMAWSEKNVTSTLHICWGAQAGLYYHYGIPKKELGKKLSGIYSHRVMNRKEPLVRGFDDVFNIPHSRYTESDNEMIKKDKRLMVMAESDEAGIFLCMDKRKRRIFVMGHPEYDRVTLDKEYKRDLGKGINPDIPKNYYPDNNPKKEPVLSWRGHANTLYTNWVNYYVYQVTPYEL
ncbi:MAG: homoserine O-succinyltransferase [Lachnospiraceae bacterium]|nr:homoserine O-succinyltransferase [Lachnospiraceae bacterium]